MTVPRCGVQDNELTVRRTDQLHGRGTCIATLHRCSAAKCVILKYRTPPSSPYVRLLAYLLNVPLSGCNVLNSGQVCKLMSMRVDLSPRLGGDTRVSPQLWREIDGQSSGQSTPPLYCPPLIHLHSPPPPERCKVSQQVWNRVMN